MRKALLVIAIIALFALPKPVFADSTKPLSVYYQGPNGNVRNALAIDKNFRATPGYSNADVIILNGTLPDPAGLRARVSQGAGLVLILGPDISNTALSILFDESLSIEKREEALSLDAAPGIADPLLSDITWTSATQVRERYELSDASAFTPLVNGYENGALALGLRQLGAGRVYLFTAYLDGANSAFQDWAYFNYFIYHLAVNAAGQPALSFAAYPGSPVPHAEDRVVLFILLAAILGTAVIAFVLVRRYSRAHPELIDSVLADRDDYASREAGTAWEEVGFHRPLGGFFLALFLGMVLFVPLIIYQNLILPVYILPSAQSLGIWGRVTQAFTLAWTFFDMGTSTAFVKYIAQHRVRDPRRGLQYGQVFVWWQALSGAVQVTLVVALASTVVPQTAYAIYAWSVIIHTFIQIPGFYQVMRHALTGLQRFDYAQVIDIALYALFPMLTQPVFVAVMMTWGRAHPVIGASMGGLLGLGLAAYAAEALAFGIGLLLYRRLGYSGRVYFLAHFDWEIIKDSFRFGIFEMVGSAIVASGQFMEILATQSRMVNYAEVWGNWVLAQNFVFGYNVIQNLYASVMPSISEAISQGHKVLSRYYAAVSYQWGGISSAFLASIMLAVADRFILGASGPEFVRAAAYAVPLLLWGAVQYPAWVADNVQRGANKPYLMVFMVVLEQTVRIGLIFALIARLQITALIVAYFVGIMLKNAAAYFVNDRLCFKQAIYAWPAIAAPLLAGAAHFAVLRFITGLVWRGDQISSVLIFFIAILPSFPLFAFFYGLFGGWEEATLAEVHRAVGLSSFMRPLAYVFWAATSLGARVSPLHNRFRMDIRPQAMAEAAALTAERISLLAQPAGALPAATPAGAQALVTEAG